MPLGLRIADKIAATVGSWPFVIIQTIVLALWIIFNLVAYIKHWDPYPFILLNLFLSFQAAYTAPFILMSQNRQSEIDRHTLEADHKVNAETLKLLRSIVKFYKIPAAG